MKRSPVKKKINTPPKAEEKNPVKVKEPEQMAITRRQHLLSLIHEANDVQLQELYQQIMGIKWKHGVAELGCCIREIMTRRKYGST